MCVFTYENEELYLIKTINNYQYLVLVCPLCRKMKNEEEKGSKSGAVTHSTRASHAPCWEEMVTVSVDEDRAPDEGRTDDRQCFVGN